MRHLLLIGCGDVAWRALPGLLPHRRVFALLRRNEEAARWRAAGAVPLIGDLDDRASLRRLAGLAADVLHLAPPGQTASPPQRAQGKLRDQRTRNLLAALAWAGEKSLPQRLVYVSTSGIYGDCAGARIDETRTPAPATARGQRRLDAETVLRQFGRRTGVSVSILRAPGIYAAERLPLARLSQQLPVLQADQDVYTNHIHADDLAAACLAALHHGRPNRAYHASDDGELRMGEYFDQVADAFALPRPPRLPRSELAQRLSAVQLSFMSESRRLDNTRLHRELRLRLRYPTVAAGLQAAARLPGPPSFAK